MFEVKQAIVAEYAIEWLYYNMCAQFYDKKRSLDHFMYLGHHVGFDCIMTEVVFNAYFRELIVFQMLFWITSN